MSRRGARDRVEALLLLRQIRSELRSDGLGAVLDLSGKQAALSRRGYSAPRAEAQLDEALGAVTFAIRIFPGVTRCLETSLVAWLFLARRGFDVELLFAVRRYPFAAHAWVELVPSRRVLTSKAFQGADRYTVILRRRLIAGVPQADTQADSVACGTSVVTGATG